MSQDPDSLEDVESSLMECDPQEKLDFTEDKLFQVWIILFFIIGTVVQSPTLISATAERGKICDVLPTLEIKSHQILMLVTVPAVVFDKIKDSRIFNAIFL